MFRLTKPTKGEKMGIINILAIGNSFSEDATRYLHLMAMANGIQTKIVNLYIGGCSLEQHWRNIEEDHAEYQYQQNGVSTDRYVSIREILQEENWDYIVTQQASHDSGWYESYEPFLELIIDYLKKEVPYAEIFLQETWAYENNSTHPNFMRYHRDQTEMYERLRRCYMEIARKYQIRLIPSGDAVQAIRKTFQVSCGGLSICRDGYHMSFLYGRYLLACVWLKTLFSASLENIVFIPCNTETGEWAEAEFLQQIHQVVRGL